MELLMQWAQTVQFLQQIMLIQWYQKIIISNAWKPKRKGLLRTLIDMINGTAKVDKNYKYVLENDRKLLRLSYNCNIRSQLFEAENIWENLTWTFAGKNEKKFPRIF